MSERSSNDVHSSDLFDISSNHELITINGKDNFFEDFDSVFGNILRNYLEGYSDTIVLKIFKARFGKFNFKRFFGETLYELIIEDCSAERIEDVDNQQDFSKITFIKIDKCDTCIFDFCFKNNFFPIIVFENCTIFLKELMKIEEKLSSKVSRYSGLLEIEKCHIILENCAGVNQTCKGEDFLKNNDYCYFKCLTFSNTNFVDERFLDNYF